MARPKSFIAASGVLFLTLVFALGSLGLSMFGFSFLIAALSLVFGQALSPTKDYLWPFTFLIGMLPVQLISLGYAWFFTERKPWGYGRKGWLIFPALIAYNLIGLGTMLAAIIRSAQGLQPLNRPGEFWLAVILMAPFFLGGALPVVVELIFMGGYSLANFLDRLSEGQFSLSGWWRHFLPQSVSRRLTPSKPDDKKEPPQPEPGPGNQGVLTDSFHLAYDRDVGRDSYLIVSANREALADITIGQYARRQDFLLLRVFAKAEAESEEWALLSQTASVDADILEGCLRKGFQVVIAQGGWQTEIERAEFRLEISITDTESDGEVFDRLQLHVKVYEK